MGGLIEASERGDRAGRLGSSLRAEAFRLAFDTVSAVTGRCSELASEVQPSKWVGLLSDCEVRVGDLLDGSCQQRLRSLLQGQVRELGTLPIRRRIDEFLIRHPADAGLGPARKYSYQPGRLEELEGLARQVLDGERPISTIEVPDHAVSYLEDTALFLVGHAAWALSLRLLPAPSGAAPPVRWAVVAALHAEAGCGRRGSWGLSDLADVDESAGSTCSHAKAQRRKGGGGGG